MPLLRTEEHEGLVCRFYDGGIVMVGTTAADRFSFRLNVGDDFATRFKQKLEECRATQPVHQGRKIYRKRPTAEQERNGL